MKNLSSHLFQRVASFLQVNDLTLILRFLSRFSSLSESGFIPTEKKDTSFSKEGGWVLISFREWLHSYWVQGGNKCTSHVGSSHLFQRVASFLLIGPVTGKKPVKKQFSSLSESGFIPTREGLEEAGLECKQSSHLFQRVASFLQFQKYQDNHTNNSGSHLFQRVASFLLSRRFVGFRVSTGQFSSLSESGFIPTSESYCTSGSQGHQFSSLSESGFIPTFILSRERCWICSRRSHLFQRVASFLPKRCQICSCPVSKRFSSLSESGFIPTYVGDLHQG